MHELHGGLNNVSAETMQSFIQFLQTQTADGHQSSMRSRKGYQRRLKSTTNTSEEGTSAPYAACGLSYRRWHRLSSCGQPVSGAAHLVPRLMGEVDLSPSMLFHMEEDKHVT